MAAFLRCLLGRPRYETHPLWERSGEGIFGGTPLVEVCEWCGSERGSARHP